MFKGFGISLSNEEPVATTLALIQRADRLGYDEVSLPESRHFRSVFSVAAAAMATTDQITVRIGVANPVTRHPAILAMEAGTLAEIGQGRLRFGIGAAAWTMRALGYVPDGWKPYSNTVEAARAIRQLLTGQPLGFTPATFPATPETCLDFTPPQPIAVDLGAVNARMMEAVGEVGDGVQLGALASPGYVAWARERIAAGAARAGRDPADMLVASNVLTSVAKDRRAARDAVREVLAYYLYRVETILIEAGGDVDRDQVARIGVAVNDHGVAEGAKLVNDHLIDTFAVAGTVDDVVEGFGRFVAAGLEIPLAWYTFGPDPDWAIDVLASEVRPALHNLDKRDSHA
jgi:5,10-methylenetetrahydromethanopterin reductase